MVYTVDTSIHHVEHWGSVATNIRYSSDSEDEKRREIDLDKLDDFEYYKRAVDQGKGISRYANGKWMHTMYFDILGVDRNKNNEYDIKPMPGGVIPFDYDGRGNIDLIVADVGGKEWHEKVIPAELLDEFDLTICKASFDGKKFHIPDPHRTFKGETTMEPNRRAVVESYVRHFKSPGEKRLGPIEQSRLASTAIEALRKDVPVSPFYHQLDFAARLPDRYTGAEFGDDWDDPHKGTLYDTMVQAKYGASISFHNWIRKLITRLHKYQKRGIEVVGAPSIGDDVCIDYFSISDFD